MRLPDKASYWLLVLPALATMIVFYIWPVLGILNISVSEPRPGLGNYVAITQSNAIRVSLKLTFRIAVLTTAGALILGYVLAYTITNFAHRLRPLMLALVMLPFWVSSLIRSFAWIMLLGRSGVVNDTLRGAGVIETPMRLMHNELGVVIAMIHVMLPFAVLPLMTNMRGISDAYVKAARGLGASEWTAFRKVYFPQTMPGVLSAALLVFVLSLGFYITPALLGGGRVMMLSEYITYQIQELLNWGLGSALSVVLLGLTALVLVLAARFINLRKTLLERS